MNEYRIQLLSKFYNVSEQGSSNQILELKRCVLLCVKCYRADFRKMHDKGCIELLKVKHGPFFFLTYYTLQLQSMFHHPLGWSCVYR